MKVEEFYEPVFEVSVLFLTDTTPDEVDVWMKKNRDGTVLGNLEKNSGSIYLLDNTDKKGRVSREYVVIVEDKKGFYTLIHETHHLASHIMEDRLIPIRQENDEVSAYIQNYWFRTLWRFMNNKEVVLEKK